jgi:3-methyl-2-oxobutanoate hydroxymethyltransferase
MKEGGCDAVKLEGGAEIADRIAAIVKTGIPVMGHIGMTPQTASAFGGFKLQAKDYASAKKIIEDAKELERAGCFMIGPELIPNNVTRVLTKELSIPVQSIGSGISDGASMNTYDLLGIFNEFKPKFVRRYANLREEMINVFNKFHEDTQSGDYPAPNEYFTIEIEGFED